MLPQLQSLGAGLDLPAIPTAAETAALVAKGGGGGVGEAVPGRAHKLDVATAPDRAVWEAVLGRTKASTYHHGSKEDVDDADRDKAYRVPPIVVEKLAARLGGKSSHHSS